MEISFFKFLSFSLSLALSLIQGARVKNVKIINIKAYFELLLRGFYNVASLVDNLMEIYAEGSERTTNGQRQQQHSKAIELPEKTHCL